MKVLVMGAAGWVGRWDAPCQEPASSGGVGSCEDCAAQQRPGGTAPSGSPPHLAGGPPTLEQARGYRGPGRAA